MVDLIESVRVALKQARVFDAPRDVIDRLSSAAAVLQAARGSGDRDVASIRARRALALWHAWRDTDEDAN